MRIATTAVLTAAALTCTAGPALAAADASAKDKAAITKVVKTVDGRDPAKACAGFTAGFRKKMFGSEKQCEAQSGDGTAAGKITVSSISVSGSKAKAKVTEHGSDGARGTWQLSRVGGSWQVSAIGADYWRSGYANSWGPKYKSGGADDPFADKAYRACGLKGLLDRGDKAFLAFTYEQGLGHNKVLGTVFSACSSKAPGGKSPFRTMYEKALKKGFKKAGAPAAFSDCVVKKLRGTVSEPSLINAVMDGTESRAFAKLNDKMKVAATACARGGAAGQVRPPQGIVAPHPVR